jgi:hypothetical protein
MIDRVSELLSLPSEDVEKAKAFVSLEQAPHGEREAGRIYV